MYPALLSVIMTCLASNILPSAALTVTATVAFKSTSDGAGDILSDFPFGIKWAGAGAALKNADKIDDILESSFILV